MRLLTILIIAILTYAQPCYSVNIRQAVEYYDGKPCLVYIVAINTEKIIKPIDIDFIHVSLYHKKGRIRPFQNKIFDDTLYAYFTYQDFQEIEDMISVYVSSDFSYFLDLIEWDCIHKNSPGITHPNLYTEVLIDENIYLDNSISLSDNRALKSDSEWLNRMRHKDIIPVYNLSIFQHRCINDSTVNIYVKITNNAISRPSGTDLLDEIAFIKDNKYLAKEFASGVFDDNSLFSVFSDIELELPDIVDIGFSTSIGNGMFRDINLKSKIKKIE